MSWGELLARDVHPAEVLLPDGRLIRDARVFVTTHRLLIWERGEGHEVKQTHALDLAESHSVQAQRGTLARSADGLEVQTTDGVVFLNRGYGCGCGSPLLALTAPVGWL